MINEYIKLFLETNQTNETFEEYLKGIAERSRIEKEKEKEKLIKKETNTESTEMSTEEYIRLLSYKAKP